MVQPVPAHPLQQPGDGASPEGGQGKAGHYQEVRGRRKEEAWPVLGGKEKEAGGRLGRRNQCPQPVSFGHRLGLSRGRLASIRRKWEGGRRQEAGEHWPVSGDKGKEPGGRLGSIRR